MGAAAILATADCQVQRAVKCPINIHVKMIYS